MPSKRTELTTVKNLISQVDLILADTELPENRIARCRELLKAAVALTDDLIGQQKTPAAVVLGKKGGSQTAKRGSDYFRQIAAKRKTRGGGRPRKNPSE
jgi:hypothetical protein